MLFCEAGLLISSDKRAAVIGQVNSVRKPAGRWL